MRRFGAVQPGAKRLAAGELSALRMAARLAFVHEQPATTCAELAIRPELARAGLARLLSWAEEEDWEGQRETEEAERGRYAEAQAERALKRLHGRRLRQVEALQEEAARWRTHRRLQPKSWEAVAAVQLRAAQLAHQMATDAASSQAITVQPEAAAADQEMSGEELRVDLTAEEAQEVAHQMLKQRLERRLAAAEQSPQHPPLAREASGT